MHQQKELAKNIRLSLREYHVVGENERFTDFGRRLYNLKDDEGKLFDELARHILLDSHGIDLLRAIASLQALREEPTLLAIAKELERAGIIKFLSDPGAVVLDPFAGSNVTGEVAEGLARRWLAFELVEEYLRGSRFRFEPAGRRF